MARGPTEQQLFDELEARYGQAAADAFAQAIENLKTAAEIGRAAAAIEAGDFEALLAALHLDPAVFGPLLDQIGAAYQAGGETAAGFLPGRDAEGAKLVVRFNTRNPRAETWLKEQSSTLVTRIVDDQRTAIRTALDAGMQRGDNPTTTALDIVGRMDKQTGARVGGIVGLTSQQAQFVQNARAELAKGDAAYLDRTLRDRRFDSTIARALRDGTPIPAEIQDKAIVAYERRMLKLRGDTIGRTESLNALRAAKYEAFAQATDKGVDPKTITRTWRSAGDSHVRETHQHLDGQSVQGMETPFVSESGERLLYPGDSSLGAGPEEIINCFAPWTTVSALGLQAAVSRRYCGELVELAVRGMVNLAVTPNHPILTDRGWVAAGQLVKGDKLVYAAVGDGGVARAQPNVGDAHPTAEQLHRATQALGRVHRARLADVDFHGEKPDADVEVVTLPCDLRLANETASRKAFGDLALADADVGQGQFLFCRLLELGDDVLAAAADSFMRSLSAGAPSLGGRQSGGAAVAFGHAGPLDAEIRETGVDHAAADAEPRRDGQYGIAGAVEPANIVEQCRAPLRPSSGLAFVALPLTFIRRRHYEGPVYNFETATGLILAGNIITHNCRCDVSYRIDFLAALGPAPEQQAADDAAGQIGSPE